MPEPSSGSKLGDYPSAGYQRSLSTHSLSICMTYSMTTNYDTFGHHVFTRLAKKWNGKCGLYYIPAGMDAFHCWKPYNENNLLSRTSRFMVDKFIS